MKNSPIRLAFGLCAGIALLIGSGVAAQASWSGPVYSISGKKPTTYSYPTAPTTQEPYGCGGSNCYNQMASGTVTAEFTWAPDASGVAPPEDVYVLQYGTATWSVPPWQNPAAPPAAQKNSVPSYNTASFTSDDKSHFMLIQAGQGGAYGTATNGLGDEQVVTYSPTPPISPQALRNGQTGTSSGYEIVLCHPDGGKFTTPPVTLSAGASPPQGAHFFPYWRYNCRAMNVGMSRNAADITNSEVPVMVGEQNAMSVAIGPLPQGWIPTYQWSIPGETVKGFQESVTTGQKVDLPNADLESPNPSFYWYNGTFGGDSQELSVTITILNEKTIILKGKCNVYRPRMNSFEGIYTSNIPTITYVNGGARLGGNGIGITWNASVENPSVAVAGGEIAFEQVVDLSHTFQGVSQGNPYNNGAIKADCLDSLDSDPRYSNSATPIASNATQIITSDDSPALGPLNSDNTYQADDHFTTYLVYKPTGNSSIWVVLGSLNWIYKFEARYDDPPTVQPYPTWIVTSHSPTGTVSGTDTHEFPKWVDHAQDVPEIPMNP